MIRAMPRPEDLPEARYVLDIFARDVECSPGPASGLPVLCWGVPPPPDVPAVVVPRVSPASLEPLDLAFAPDAPLPPSGRAVSLLRDAFSPGPPPGEPWLRDAAGRVLAAREGPRITFAFDLLFNAFARLSSLAEWNREAAEAPLHGYPPPGATPLGPDVDVLFALLDAALDAVGAPPRRPRGGWGLVLSHDVDYVTKTLRLRARRGLVLAYNAARSLLRGRPLRAAAGAARALAFPFRPGRYFRLREIMDLEEAAGVRSSFYFFAKTSFSGQTSDQRRIDPVYDIGGDPRLRAVLPELRARGFEVGLHGSCNSFDRPDMLRAERDRLEEVAGAAPMSLRQHWLRFAQRRTWNILEELGFRCDLTAGWNDRPGFRTGLTRPHPPYDHARRRPRPILSVPTPLQDGTLFQYLNLDDAEAWEACRRVLEAVRDFRGFASIDWHQRTIAADYGWYDVYRRILEWLRREGGAGLSCAQWLDRHGRN